MLPPLSLKQPIQRGPVKVGLLLLQVRLVGKDLLQINGTSSSNKNGDEWTNAQLFIQGTEGNSQKSTITGGTLEFISQNPATNDANNAPGVGYNAVVLGGNSSLTIDVGTLLLGDSVIDQTDKKRR